jgi:MarR family transcriptional regulator, organic hydroperoxide resistance regulator
VNEIEQPIGRLLGIAGRMVGARFQRVLDANGLSLAGWQVLVLLGRTDNLPLRDVAERCYVSSATVTGVVDTLERDGLVVRERDTTDRRVVRVRLTKPGRHRLEAAWWDVNDAMTAIFGDLSERDEKVVRRFLLRTIARLNEEGTP